MKIGDRIFVRGYIDEIRKDTVIVRNDGGYFGTVLSEVTGELPSAQPERIIHCKDCKYGILDSGFPHQRFCSFKGNEWNNDDHFCGHAKRREVTT